MITDEVKGRLLRQLEGRLETLTQERHVGHTGYHFCHPMQLKFRQEKDAEIDECKDLMRLLESLYE